MSEKLTRCFIALELSRESINEIKKVQKLLKEKVLFTGKLTEPENLHLTLKFLGEISDDKIEEVKKRLRDIKVDRDRNAELGEIGYFSKAVPRIIWVKLNGKIVFELQKKIDETLAELFGVENRFMSHITIARIKYIKDKKWFKDYLKSVKARRIGFEVKDFVLKSSELFPEGPVYSDVERYELKNIA